MFHYQITYVVVAQSSRRSPARLEVVSSNPVEVDFFFFSFSYCRIEVKPVDPSLESFNSEVIYFLLCTVSWILKSISVTRPINRADLHLILYSNAK